MRLTSNQEEYRISRLKRITEQAIYHIAYRVLQILPEVTKKTENQGPSILPTAEAPPLHEILPNINGVNGQFLSSLMQTI